MHVAENKFSRIAKLGFIHLPFIFINVVGKTDMPTGTLQSHSHQANAREKFCKGFF